MFASRHRLSVLCFLVLFACGRTPIDQPGVGSSSGATDSGNQPGKKDAASPGNETKDAAPGKDTQEEKKDAFVAPDAVLTSVLIQGTPLTIPVFGQQPLHAVASYGDGSTVDVTDVASWRSSNEGVVQVTNGPRSHGVATGVSIGQATVFASFAGMEASGMVSVERTVIALEPAAPSRALGESVMFTVTVVSGPSPQGNALWSSSNGIVATVAAGQAQCRTPGTTTITVSVGGNSAMTTLSCVDPNLEAVLLTPGSTSVPKGTRIQFYATAYFKNVSAGRDVSGMSTWSSSDTNIATVISMGNMRGIVTTVAAGQVDISAAYGGMTGKVTLTVTEH